VTAAPPDYVRVFHTLPVPLLLLTPDLEVVDANRAWLDRAAPMLDRSLLHASLQRARITRRPDTVPMQRYAERFWTFQTVPVVDGSGAVALLLHRADDITDHVHEAEHMRQVEAELRVLGERQQRTERRRAQVTGGLAETLQRSLLTEPPQPAGLDIAVRYRPAAQEAQVGGDWYDAFLSPGGPVTLVVGDVTGHDWTSAAIAGQLRNMLRGIAFAFDIRAPELLLTALDRALAATGVPTLASAVVARIERTPTAATGARLFRWSNAGHPPPLLVRSDGGTDLLDRPRNLLLGVAADRPRHQHAVELGPGDIVVLYTDGLVERRDATFDDGIDLLRSAALELACRPVGDLCDELLLRLDPEPTDDIALLVLRVRDDGPC
jgi:serine phosphatase RsbU (regulator of sigma subunit)